VSAADVDAGVPASLEDDVVVVDVPARPRSLRLLRLAAADAAADLDLDIDAVESARIAVDELSAILLSSGPWQRLVVRFRAVDGRLRVEGEAFGPVGEPVEPVVDRVVEELLTMCVEEYGIGDGPKFWFDIAARSAGPAGTA
jgi:hypothetical protein